ncbi:hypothetical protein HBB16_16990 [Pseudonocardia sp. MCCB 268]|nr:hypothetical protein [Pseudonocardia cytotoxica]
MTTVSPADPVTWCYASSPREPGCAAGRRRRPAGQLSSERDVVPPASRAARCWEPRCSR